MMSDVNIIFEIENNSQILRSLRSKKEKKKGMIDFDKTLEIFGQC